MAIQKNVRLKEVTVPFGQMINLGRIEKTKGLGLGLVNSWRSNKICSYSLLSLESPPKVKRMSLFSWSREGTIPRGDLFCFLRTKEDQIVLALAVS